MNKACFIIHGDLSGVNLLSQTITSLAHNATIVIDPLQDIDAEIIITKGASSVNYIRTLKSILTRDVYSIYINCKKEKEHVDQYDIVVDDLSNEALNELAKNIITLVYDVEKYKGLRQLTESINRSLSCNFSIIDTVYYIRQLSIAHGCIHSCCHCFSNSPHKVDQMNLVAFKRLIQEIGDIVNITHRKLQFFHLGAATDPASVHAYHLYLDSWISSFPLWYSFRLFTHGWNMYDPDNLAELHNTLIVLDKHKNQIDRIVVSFDDFSILARRNWEDYLYNVVNNINAILSTFSKEKIRIEVFYHPARNHANAVYTLDYWREFVKSNPNISYQSIHKTLSKASDVDDCICAKVTTGLFKVFESCGFAINDIIELSRDCNSIFPAGRGVLLFNGKYSEDKTMAINIQKERVLYPLSNYPYGYKGCIIYPHGAIRLVDYLGFNEQSFLNDGESVIDYIL